MAFELADNTSVSDLAITRERIWTRTRAKNRYHQPIIVDTGWDLVTYPDLGSGIEPGTNNFEQRADGKVPDKRYTGIHIVDEGSDIAKRFPSTGGPIPRGAF